MPALRRHLPKHQEVHRHGIEDWEYVLTEFVWYVSVRGCESGGGSVSFAVLEEMAEGRAVYAVRRGVLGEETRENTKGQATSTNESRPL